MAANQKNFGYFSYTDDNGVVWNKRGLIDAAANGIDGSTPVTAGAPLWVDTKRHRTRKAVFFDPATFRTADITVYTPAAFAAITNATTLSVNVPGEVAALNYALAEKVPERQTVARAVSRNLADHA